MPATPATPPHRLSLERIAAAPTIIDPVFLDSPQYLCEPLGAALGARLVLKVETLNPIRSFKGRGADLCVARLPSGEPVICASAGNFGQAMAYACRARGLTLTVYASVNANPLKVARMRDLGATVLLHGEDFDAAKTEAKRVAATTGARMIEDSLDIATAEGAGTIGLELLGLPTPLDALVVPLGNGALLAGVARVMKTHSPTTRIIGVQAAGAPAMTESLRTGQVVTHERIATIADGIGVRLPVPEALDDLRGMVDETILVRESSIVAAMRLVLRQAGLIVEPSGAVGVAAILEQPDQFRDRWVGTILCGSNLTDDQMKEWLGVDR